MKAEDITKILIIGAGTMACHVGAQFALFGRKVVIYARSSDKEQIVLERIRQEVLPPIIKDGFTTWEYAEKCLENISFIVNDPSQIPQDIDVVNESVYEEYEVKEKVWSQFAPYLPKHAILTTCSSSLLASRFAGFSGAPERFLAWHFYMPCFYRNVTEIIPMAQTDRRYAAVLKELAADMHMNAAFLNKETPGYLANNMLYSFVNMGLTLYRTGAADFTEIDRAWMGVRLEKSGPFGILDAAGIDTMYSILRNWEGTDPANLPILEEKLSQGHLGAKSGKGFYDYPHPLYQRPDFLRRAGKLS